MSRLTATDRMRRLLAVIPWVSGRGEVELAEIVERFDYPLDRLRRDLTEIVQFVGVYPHTPDMLIEVFLDEENERVRFELADYFTSPLQLTPEEALSLVSAGLGLLGSSAGQNTALERALAKIADRFELQIGDQIDVSLGGADPKLVDQATAAMTNRTSVTIDYYSLHRGATTRRTVDPHQVYSQDGEWYLRGYCHLADEVRTFRLDRVLSLITTDSTFEAVATDPAPAFSPSDDDVRVTLRLAPSAAWVAEAYPVERFTALDDGYCEVELAASSVRWLERLLLQLGSAATLLAADPPLPDGFRGDAARAVLARYQ